MASKKTFAEIITEGLDNAGRLDLTVNAKKNLNSWLRSRYKDWLWPFLRGSVERLSLPAGTTSLLFGSGSIVSGEVLRILNPIWLSDATYNSPTMCNILNLDNTNINNEDRVNDPTIVRGIPQRFKIYDTGVGTSGAPCKIIVPVPVPDKQYYISFDCTALPGDLTADADIPKYPNDSTMIMFVEYWARKYSNGPADADVQALKQDLAGAVAADRIKDGMQVGTNDVVVMDPSIYQ